MKMSTIGLVAALAVVGLAAMPAAQAVDVTPDPDNLVQIQDPCVGLYQKYPDGSTYWLLYPVCVAV